jgi:hypothetical protein
LPAFLLPRGANGSDPAAGLAAELGDAEQLLHLGLYHQGLMRTREEKVVDGAAELVSFVSHLLDRLLSGRVWNICSMLFSKDDSKSPY